MPDLFVGGMIVGNYIQTHGNREGGDYASIGTGPYCCHGTSIVPQHMGMAQKPPVKLFMLWSVNGPYVVVFLRELFDSLSCSTRSATPYHGVTVVHYLKDW